MARNLSITEALKFFHDIPSDGEFSDSDVNEIENIIQPVQIDSYPVPSPIQNAMDVHYPKAEISSNNTTKLYYGSCSTDFKARFSNHKHSFTHRNKRNATELSKEVWRAKDNGVEPSIKWSIVSTAPSYNCGGTRCNLCLAEKLAIFKRRQKNNAK